MSANLIAKANITIEASATEVWNALTDPALIRQYYFGTEAVSDWKEGSDVTFTGEWQGKRYHDKGKVLRAVPEEMLQFTFFSASSGLEDTPENYQNIIYNLQQEDGSTIVSVKQENIPNEEHRKQLEANWIKVLENLKNLLENDLRPRDGRVTTLDAR